MEMSKDVCNLKRTEHEYQFETGIQVVAFKTGSLSPQTLPACESVPASQKTLQGTSG